MRLDGRRRSRWIGLAFWCRSRACASSAGCRVTRGLPAGASDDRLVHATRPTSAKTRTDSPYKRGRTGEQVITRAPRFTIRPVIFSMFFFVNLHTRRRIDSCLKKIFHLCKCKALALFVHELALVFVRQ